MTSMLSDSPRSGARVGAHIVVRDLHKRFSLGADEITATDGVSLEFEPGAMTALTGASGSGKSTLLHLIGAIEIPDAGSITVDGQELTGQRSARLADYRRGIGFVFQRFHLLPTLTALDNVIAPTLPYHTRFDRVARARELLDAVGLAGRERSLPAHLSGGQQQRVAIARALLSRPALLLADEPTGNLDSATSTEIMDLIEGVRQRYPMTVVVATHEDAVTRRCDRVVRLRDGRVVEDSAS
ncbi:ABC transporter ATP-binding protein [Rhizomonospora bruguierae]|uniref:ABC transporter ATP-binding protein n=1 Tax=Rhizomonospora bruguierae TaxID=1581705 RepID=UPI001BCB426C|nr:ABC transporter ATP-binding protein [Micromonospora sp. NBRC 107566]